MQKCQIFSVCCVLIWTESKEFCHNEEFTAECTQPDEVILITSALYGRMSIGPCVKTDFGFIGCYEDVIDHAHARCSGRRSCNIRVPDATLDRTRPCNKDLKSYLDATFVCIAGMVVGQAPEHPVAPATIHVELFPETVVMPGTNVTVTCRVHRATVDVWPNVVLSKAVIAHDATVPREAIANNADLTPFYAKMGRFEISKNSDDTDLIFTLKITGVSVNDSGQYACADSTENQYDGKPLEVYRPPGLPYFLDQSYNRIAEDFNDTLNLIEGESSDFGCRVPNVFPTPDVHIYVNKVKSQNLEEVTPNFLITEEQNIRCTENVGMKACPLHVSYDMLVVNKDFKPTYEHDEQTLTCSTTMRQFNRDGQKITMKMNVEYKPRIQCTDNTGAKLNETNKIITCLIQSNPPVPFENKTWTIIHEGVSSLMGVNQISDEYKVEEKIYEHTGGKLSDLTLTINRVTAKTFLTQFKITAENELGSDEKALKVTLFKPIIKGGAPGLHGSNASLWKILSTMTFLMMMICFSEFH